MSRIAIRNIYNVALDGLGLLLDGAPEQPVYTQRTASVFMQRFAQGDRTENDFSWWWFWSDTDWTKGFQEEFHTDPGYFKSGHNIDVTKEAGKFQSLAEPQTFTRLSVGTLASITAAKPYGATLAVGVSKTSGTAALFTVATDGTATAVTVPGNSGNAITQIDSFLQKAFVGFGTATAGSALGMLSGGSLTYGSLPDSTTAVRAVCTVGPALFAAYKVDTAGTGDRIATSTDGTAFTTVVNFTGGGRTIVEGGAVDYKSTLCYLVQEGNQVELWQYAYNIASRIYSWDNLTSPRISVQLSNLIVDGKVNGRVVRFIYNGSQIYKAFEQETYTSAMDVSQFVDVGGKGYSAGLLMQQDENGELVHYPSYDFQVNGTTIVPIAAFDGNVMFSNALDSSGSLCILKVNPTTGSNYVTSASACTLTSSLHTGHAPSVDKIFYDCILRTDPLQDGQVITVEYATDPTSTDGSVSWTTLGSADYAVDGAATSKRLFFSTETPVIAKAIKRRITLTNNGTASPKVQDVTFRYLPMPYYPHEWVVTVNASDTIERLDGIQDTKTGRHVRNALQTSLWKNRIVDFQDVDYATTKITTALAKTENRIFVQDTVDFPESGRLRVENEEVFYASKTPTSFEGVSRGQRDTPATTHGSAVECHNGYKVLITDMQNRIPILNRGQRVEYKTTLTFRENL